jgi:hypothetical protein
MAVAKLNFKYIIQDTINNSIGSNMNVVKLVSIQLVTVIDKYRITYIKHNRRFIFIV